MVHNKQTLFEMIGGQALCIFNKKRERVESRNMSMIKNISDVVQSLPPPHLACLAPSRHINTTPISLQWTSNKKRRRMFMHAVLMNMTNKKSLLHRVPKVLIWKGYQIMTGGDGKSWEEWLFMTSPITMDTDKHGLKITIYKEVLDTSEHAQSQNMYRKCIHSHNMLQHSLYGVIGICMYSLQR